MCHEAVVTKEKLNRISASYIADFLEDLEYVKNRFKIKTASAQMHYGTIVKITIYRYYKNKWERYLKTTCRVKCENDSACFQSTLNHYKTIIEYMYWNETDSDSD